MFQDFEKAADKQKKATNESNAADGKDGEAPMDEKEMKQFEDQFMGMFQNLAKQIEDLEDD